MIIDINILKRLGDRFAVCPVSSAPPPLQAALKKSEAIFIKAPAGVEPSITGGEYQWDDEISGYRFGNNQKLFVAPDGTTIWIFKDVLLRILKLDRVQKWTSGDAEYPMGKANAFFIVYGKLTGQNLGEGETAGDDVPDGETEPGDGGGLAVAGDENAPPYSKEEVQQMLKGEFPADIPTGPKASMATSIPGEEPVGEEPVEPLAPMSGPSPSRLAKGNTPVNTGGEADRIIRTLKKMSHVDPDVKMNKQQPVRIHGDEIIKLWHKANSMPPEEGKILHAFLTSGDILPLEEGKISKHQLKRLVERIVEGIVSEVEKSKKKKWTVKFQGKKENEDIQLEQTTTSGGVDSSPGTPGYITPGAFGKKMSHRKDHIEVLGYKMTPQGEKEYNKSADALYESIKKQVKTTILHHKRK